MRVVRQLDNLSLWSNPALLWSYAVAMGLQLLPLYTPLHHLFGVVLLDWMDVLTSRWRRRLGVISESTHAVK
jgi:hypothetical protein